MIVRLGMSGFLQFAPVIQTTHFFLAGPFIARQDGIDTLLDRFWCKSTHRQQAHAFSIALCDSVCNAGLLLTWRSGVQFYIKKAVAKYRSSRHDSGICQYGKLTAHLHTVQVMYNPRTTDLTHVGTFTKGSHGNGRPLKWPALQCNLYYDVSTAACWTHTQRVAGHVHPADVQSNRPDSLESFTKGTDGIGTPLWFAQRKLYCPNRCHQLIVGLIHKSCGCAGHVRSQSHRSD